MKKGYKFKEVQCNYPKIEMPLDMEELVWTTKACNLQLQKKFVAKSECLDELEAELQTVTSFLNEATRLENEWNGKAKRIPRLSYSAGAFGYADRVWHENAKAYLSETKEAVQQYMSSIPRAIESLRDNMRSAYRQLSEDIESERKGTEGESRVENYLVKTFDGRVLSNVVLPGVRGNDAAPKTAETDLLVFANQGLFVCEVKNYGKAGQTLEIREDGRMYKIGHNGNFLEDMGSPFAQNYWHCEAVKQALADGGVYDVPIYPAVIIANTDVNIVNHSRYWAGDMYSFRDLLYADDYETEFTVKRSQAAFTAIQNKRLIERNFPIWAITPIAGTMELALKQLANAVSVHETWVKDVDTKAWGSVCASYAQWCSLNARKCAADDLSWLNKYACSYWYVPACLLMAIPCFFVSYFRMGIFTLLAVAAMLLWPLGGFILSNVLVPAEGKPIPVFLAVLLTIPRTIVKILTPALLFLLANFITSVICWF